MFYNQHSRTRRESCAGFTWSLRLNDANRRKTFVSSRVWEPQLELQYQHFDNWEKPCLHFFQHNGKFHYFFKFIILVQTFLCKVLFKNFNISFGVIKYLKLFIFSLKNDCHQHKLSKKVILTEWRAGRWWPSKNSLMYSCSSGMLVQPLFSSGMLVQPPLRKKNVLP